MDGWERERERREEGIDRGNRSEGGRDKRGDRREEGGREG